MPSAPFETGRPARGSAPRGDAQFEGEWQGRHGRAAATTPSIVMWVPFNEGWGQYDTERIAAWTKQYDPTRLVNNASGWTDKGVGDIESTSTATRPRHAAPRRTAGGRAGRVRRPRPAPHRAPLAGRGELGLSQLRRHSAPTRRVTPSSSKRLYPLVDEGLAAAVYTQTSDCEIEVNGLLTYDRAVLKLDPGRFAGLNRGFTPPRFLTDQTLFAGDYFIVELAARPGATIRYTVDGAEPGPESALYDKPIEITGPRRRSKPGPSGPTERPA
ncbi:MAG: chitobiase/beta-hexosaminidase C-terminal domain-containing protein [Candidatus Moduliflexus flocculans]|nr:chitobiase/beta-hexosaminidase C-terminal domain-containing protein [Candidatus Moduliflexus flocculans]